MVRGATATVAVIVGGAGFVGGSLARQLVAKGCPRVVVVDNLLSGDTANLPVESAVDFIEGSITDPSILARLPHDADWVFHLATFHGNQNSMANPEADFANNLEPSFRLFHHLAFGGFNRLSKVVYSGAGCVVAEKSYDDAQATEETDTVSLRHDTPYQVSKLVGEMYAALYHARFGLPVVTARFQNVYGPGEILGAGKWRGTDATVWRNVIPTFVYKSLKHEALPVENGGQATRDFIHVDDIVEGLLSCAVAGRPGEVYNLASGVETSILDLARLINALVENPTAIALSAARDWDRSGKRFGATGKAERELGFAAKVGLREGLAGTIAWTREMCAMIDDQISRHRNHF